MNPLKRLSEFLRRYLPALALGAGVAVILIAEAPSPVAPGEQEFLSVHPTVAVVAVVDVVETSNSAEVATVLPSGANASGT